MTLILHSLTCNYQVNPLGIDQKKPNFSWKIQSDQRGMMQDAYHIRAMLGNKVVWDSGKVQSDQSIQIPYSGAELQSETRYEWQVKIWGENGQESEWSEPASFETAFFSPDEWKGQWITPNPEELGSDREEAFLLRKSFSTKKKIASARVYATAAGVYELYINGEKISEDLLSPGWTSYKHRHQYQAYDVTPQLSEGENAVGIMVANGWYKGELGWNGETSHYGSQRAVLLQLHIRYEDGSVERIVTDSSWKASIGAILYSEIYHGETYDARLEQNGWAAASFDDADWFSTTVVPLGVHQLVAQENDPSRVTETIKPVSSFIASNGDTVLDMGQNMVGRIKITVKAPAGTRIMLKHAEVLDQEGNIYFGNIRTAKQEVTYITKGEGVETYAPHFTFQGFRYVKVEGYPTEGRLPLDLFSGEVIHTDMEQTGSFECSNPLVNQLQQNITWGQRGNFLDVPTDCPQRDERLGWTGDAQVFVQTALFNYHGGAFFTKWLRDLRADQLPDGGVPFVIPNVLGASSSAAWGDAATIIPWEFYQAYGDKALLAEQFDSMKAWVEYIRRQGDNEYLWNTGFHFGDWLALDAKADSYKGSTPDDLVATAYYAHSTRIVRDAARVLGKEDEAKTYNELYDRIVAAFQHEFVSPSGRVVAPTQTAHILPLVFGLVGEKTRKRLANDLNELVIAEDYHLSTGFVGTPYLCAALSQNGYHDTAVKLLLQETYPSWLYSVNKGATTIWEHWDGIKEDGSFWSDDMNSFNHYASGAIGDWMYRAIAGLDMDPSQPAYKRIRIHPRIGGAELTYARASFNSMYGTIQSSWKLSEEEINIAVDIPANTTAEILLPRAKAGQLNLPLGNGIMTVEQKEEGVLVTAGSGNYEFVYPNEQGLKVIYTEETRLIDLLPLKEAVAVLDGFVPHLLQPPTVFGMKKRKLKDLPGLDSSAVEKMVQALNEIEVTEAVH